MRNHTNIKLYGGEFIRSNENYFEYNNYNHLINTWKLLIHYKNNDGFGYFQNISNSKMKRYENILWRKWHMTHNKLNKINFSIDNKSILIGPIVNLT